MSSFDRKTPARRVRSLRPNKRRLHVEALETRRVLSTYSIAGNVLTITGTAAADFIYLQLKAGDNTKLEVDDGGDGSADHTIDRALFDTIVVDLLAGNDFLFISESNGVFTDAEATTINGGDDADDIRGGSGNENLNGDSGNDVLYGGNGDDVLHGGDGNDQLDFHAAFADADDLYGDAGSDVFHNISAIDFVDGGADDDFLYSAQGWPGDDTITRTGTSATLNGVTWFQDIEGNVSLIGDAGNDTITGGDGPDHISGGDGNDVIYGQGGDDLLEGGPGNDELHGGAGADQMDWYSGSPGADDFYGDAGNDAIVADASDFADGGADADHVFATATAAADTVTTTGTVSKLGGVVWFQNMESVGVHGGAGNDKITLGNTTNQIFGGPGADVLTGGSLSDVIYGEDGNDKLYGKGGSDYLVGGNDNDTLDGGEDDDFLNGEAGTDTWTFTGTNAGAGETMTVDGNGANNLMGTREVAAVLQETDTVAFVEKLSVLAKDGDDTIDLSAMTDADRTLAGLQTVTLDGGNDDDTINGSDGKDTIKGLAGNDQLFGNDGADTLDGGADNDVLDGGLGNDKLTFSGTDGVDAVDGDDSGGSVVLNRRATVGGAILETDTSVSVEGLTVKTLGSNDNVDLSAVNVGATGVTSTTIDAGAGNDVLKGTTGKDTIKGLAGNDKIFGLAGNDVLDGGDGDDILVGGDGNDKLTGGTGRDFKIGGAGKDTFVGGLGGDLLVAAATSYDANTAALDAILAEWTGINNYATRTANIRTGAIPGGYKLDATTIANDAQADVMAGGIEAGDANRDWFVTHATDTVSDLEAGETRDTL